MEQTERRFAVLIDGDNISPKYIKYILDEVSDHGIATYKRIYGDWTDNTKKGWKAALLEWSVNPIQQYCYTVGKNATDSAMIIDAMDILYSGHVDGFCLVSSDSDFTKLAQRLREAGVFVMGIGEQKTPKPFRMACDTFKILEVIALEEEEITSLEEEKKQEDTLKEQIPLVDAAEDEPEITSIKEIEKAIYKTLTENTNKGRQTGMGELGSMLSKKFSDFDVRNYGYSKLSTFLENFEDFEIKKSGTTYFVQDKRTEFSKKEIENCIAEMVEQNSGQIDNLSVIYDVLKRKFPGFDVNHYGFSRISSFMRSFQKFEIKENRLWLK